MPKEINDREKSTADWVERTAGRRGSDANKCAMHDYISNRNDHCFDIIKNSIKTEVQKRDHKFEVLESKLENFISKWSMGIIVSISVSMLGAIIGFGIWEIQTMRAEMGVISDKVTATTNIINNEVSNLKIEMLKSNVNQKGILTELEKLAPEHKMLMDHLRKSLEKEHRSVENQ